MSTYYFDSSALAKYYVPEAGSAWVTQLLDAQEPDGTWSYTIAISRIGVVEVAGTISKRERMRMISSKVRQRTFALLMKLAKTRLTTLPVADAVLDSAAELTQRQALRGYDAVHLAAALTLNRQLTAAKLPPLVFASADNVLCQAATAEGLTTKNPNTI